LQNPLIGPALLRLLESEVKEEDIIAVVELLNVRGVGGSGSNSGNYNIKENRIVIC
jgi:hypothetical protein